MNADRLVTRIVSAFILILLASLSACNTASDDAIATPDYFRPPSDSTAPVTPRIDLGPAATQPSVLPTLTFTALPPSPTPPCQNDLTFLSDLTYPDGTVVLPGETIEKQWLVQNTGTCDWDARYQLRFVGGDTLGAAEKIPLYPARAGGRVTLRVTFVSPAEAGTYESQWQAEGPDGTLFGDAVYVLITVASY